MNSQRETIEIVACFAFFSTPLRRILYIGKLNIECLLFGQKFQVITINSFFSPFMTEIRIIIIIIFFLRLFRHHTQIRQHPGSLKSRGAARGRCISPIAYEDGYHSFPYNTIVKALQLRR